MINARAVLERLGFNTTSPLGAVQHVRNLVTVGESQRIDLVKTVDLIDKLTGIKPVYNDEHLALHVAQQVVIVAVQNEMFDPEEAIRMGEAKDAELRRTMPWIYAKAESTTANAKYEQVQVVEGLDVKVAVHADGTMKKGSKGVIAEELWKKHMLNCEGAPLTNKEFVALLVKEAQFTKSGANTYAYNLKNKFGIKQMPVAEQAEA